MRSILSRGFAAALALAASLGIAETARAETPVCPALTAKRSLNIIVPAYFYPTDPGAPEQWNKLIASARAATLAGFRLAVIVNANSGELASEDDFSPDYASIVERLDAAGALILAYVHPFKDSNELDNLPPDIRRPLADVETNLVYYKQFYPQIDGVFIDVNVASVQNLDYYREIRKAIYQIFGADAYTVFNGGDYSSDALQWPHAAQYRDMFDTIVIYENRGAKWGEKSFPAWIRQGAPDKHAFIVHHADELTGGTTRLRLCRAVRDLLYVVPARRNAAWFYAVQKSPESNVYGSLGTGFDTLMSVACWVNDQKACDYSP